MWPCSRTQVSERERQGGTILYGFIIACSCHDEDKQYVCMDKFNCDVMMTEKSTERKRRQHTNLQVHHWRPLRQARLHQR